MPRYRGLLGFVGIAICIAFLGCARTFPTPGADSGALNREMRALLTTLDSVQIAGDIEGFGVLMADDVVFMPPDGPAVVGRRDVVDYYRGLCAQMTLTIQHQPAESVAEGRLVVHRGRAVGSLRPKSVIGSDVTFDNKYLYVLRRGDDGRLRFIRVMFNSGRAPAPKA